MTTQEPLEDPTQMGTQELQQKLQEAELAEAVRAASNAEVLNVVSSAESAGRSRLGPTVFLPVRVNGTPINALVDRGAPATIISLQFALKVLTQLRRSDETDKQWREATMKNFHDPNVVLKRYGGQRLDFMAQIELSLSRGDQEMKTVLVKKDAPNDLLIGTNVQPELGFSLVVTESNGKATDLFDGGEVTMHRDFIYTGPGHSPSSCSKEESKEETSQNATRSEVTPSCPNTSLSS